MLVPLGNTPFACSYEPLTALARNLRLARTAKTGGRLADRVPAVNLEDVPGDNAGPQRSTTADLGKVVSGTPYGPVGSPAAWRAVA
jgi:hypothetical protein